jgi:hypothetical protein
VRTIAASGRVVDTRQLGCCLARIHRSVGFNGCFNVKATLAQVRSVIGATHASSEVHVESDAAAVRLRFLGSPTVRIDGIDVDTSACARDDHGVKYRVYSVGSRASRNAFTPRVNAQDTEFNSVGE